MALIIDPATKVVSIPQSDLTLVTGTLYSLDTNQFRLDLKALISSETYIWMDDPHLHNTEVTVAGTTYARTISTIDNWSYTFIPDAQYSVRLEGSNNDFFDIEAGNLNQNQVQVIPTNSAGLIVNEQQSLSQGDIDNIADAVWDEPVADHTSAGSFGEWVRNKLLTVSKFIGLQ